MVDMGMGDEEKINFVGLVNIHIPVAFFDFRVALMHAAINGPPMSLCLQNVTGAGDRPGRPHKFYFHSPDPLWNILAILHRTHPEMQ